MDIDVFEHSPSTSQAITVAESIDSVTVAEGWSRVSNQPRFHQGTRLDKGLVDSREGAVKFIPWSSTVNEGNLSYYENGMSVKGGAEPEWHGFLDQSDAEPETEPEPTVESEPFPESEKADSEWAVGGNGTDLARNWNSESVPEPERESEPGVYVEPVPEWDEAMSVWGVAWELHVYVTGILFVLIAIYSFACIIKLKNRTNLISKGFFISLHLMLFVIGVTRGVYFLVDPYNADELFHPVLAYFLFSTTFPCLTAAFSLQLLALIQTLRIRPSASKIYKLRVLASIITAHFLLSVTTDVLVGGFATGRVMVLVCQAAFVCWGLVISCAYFYVFRRLYGAARRRQGIVRQLSKAHRTNSRSSPTGYFEKPKLTMVIALKFTMMTSLSGLSLAALQLYAMFSAFNVLSTKPPEAWPWWTYQLCMRLLELLMCLTMLYVASQPVRYNMHGGKSGVLACHELLFLLPCHRICAEADMEGVMTSEELKYLDNSSSPNYVDCRSTPGNQYKTFPTEFPSPAVKPKQRTNSTSGVVSATNAAPVKRGKSHSKVSMLINDSGFIRFREDGDADGEPVYISTDDELSSSHANSRAASKKSWTPASADLRRQLPNRCIDGTCIDKAPGSVSALGHKKSASVPNTGPNTPAEPRTPLSFCSTEFSAQSDIFSFKPPSSIHLRESIDRALNYEGFRLKTPDSQNISDTVSQPNTPDSCGANNRAFIFDARGCIPDPTTSVTVVNNEIKARRNARFSATAKSGVLLKHIEEIRSKGGSSLSLTADPERFAGSQIPDSDISQEELARRVSLCRSNSDCGSYDVHF